MSGFNKISRASLYESDKEFMLDQEGSDVYIPSMEFEFVEVDNTAEEENKVSTNHNEESISESVEDGEENGNEEENEFDFPLFSAPLTTKNNENTDKGNEEERGRTEKVSSIMKVSLREDSVEKIVNERPSSFYFASYTDEEKQKFESIAISAEDIYKELENCKTVDPTPWKCIDLSDHNKKIENIINAELKKKNRKRLGKSKRICIIETRKRVNERKAIAKKAEDEKMVKLKKKIFHKRGGKKHKKLKAVKSNIKPKSSKKMNSM